MKDDVFVSDNWRNIISVSYTHLDVYKRQVQHHSDDVICNGYKRTCCNGWIDFELLQRHRYQCCLLYTSASPTPSKWRELFDFLETNKSWLRHSQNIAMLMLDRMEELGMSQKQLAEKMNCSPQYISKVLRGRENLSLETLTKIENALEISLIKGEPVAV